MTSLLRLRLEIARPRRAVMSVTQAGRTTEIAFASIGTKDEKSASTRARRLPSVNDCINRRRIKRSGLSLKLAARLHARRRKGTLVVISRNAHRVNSMTKGSATSVGRSRRLPSYSQMFKQGSLVSISRLASRERTTRIWSAPVACAVSRSVRI